MTFVELRRALRSLARAPGVAIAAIGTLALGIGATTAVFSVVDGVLLRPLPYPESERVVQIWQVGERSTKSPLSEPNFEDLDARNRSFGAFARYASRLVSVSGGVDAVRLRSAVVSRGFFDVLGVTPVLGRTFTDAERHPGAEPVALVSYGFWQRSLGGSMELDQRPLRLERELYRVVGVLPRGFGFPEDADVWIAAERFPPFGTRTAHNWKAVGRLGAGVPIERARSELSAIARELHDRYGDATWMVDAAVVPLREELVSAARPLLLVVLGAVGFLLFIATANVANLLLARALARGHEVAVAAALGATRGSLLKPFFLEALLLSIAGGGLGVLLAFGAIDALRAFDPGTLPRSAEIAVNLPMLGLAAALTLVTALVTGLLSGWRAARAGAKRSLHETRRSSGRRMEGGRLRELLVVSQVSLTLVLLVGAGLLGRSFYRLLEVDPGFQSSGSIVIELAFPPPESDEERRELGRMHDRLLDSLGGLPGVERVGSVDRLPMATGFRNGMFLKVSEKDRLESFDDFGRLAQDPSRVGEAEYRAASSGYFETLGIPLVRGRLFDERDGPEAPHVALVSEALAETAWPGQDPLGQLVEFGNMDGDLRLMRVVGVVGDVRHGGLDAAPRPTLYCHSRQRPPSSFTLVLDAPAGEEVVLPAASRVLRALAPDVPPRASTVEEVVSASTAGRKFALLLVAAFGGAALALAVIGIYGVLAYSVSERRGEIGLRIALGAAPGDVLRSVAYEGLRVIGVGLAIGLVAALALSRTLASLLFEIRPADPWTFVGFTMLLGVVGLTSCLVPAVRASRLDPNRTLQGD